MTLIVALALLGGAALVLPLAYLALRGRRREPEPVEDAPLALSELAAHDGREVTVTGVAVAGSGAPVESRLAGAECVWHRHEVRRHYWLWRDVAEGERRRDRHADVIADHEAPRMLALVDPGAAGTRRSGRTAEPVRVEMAEADTSGLNVCLQRVVGRLSQRGPAAADDLLARVQGRIRGVFRGETIEFEYLEWVVRPGDRVVVHGRVEVRDGGVVLAAPRDGRVRVGHAPVESPPAR